MNFLYSIRYFWSAQMSVVPTPERLIRGVRHATQHFRLPPPDRVWTLRSAWEPAMADLFDERATEVSFDEQVHRDSGGLLFAIDFAELQKVGGSARPATTRPASRRLAPGEPARKGPLGPGQATAVACIKCSVPSPRSGQCARLIAASILGLLVGWLTACSGSERGPSAPRLVILYATCTLNKDYLSPYSPEVAYTPHLQRLARRSTVFTSHRTESAQSGIAFASIFSGVQAPVHGVFSHPREIPDSVELITEAFAANGYDTYSYLYHFLAEANLGYAQGVPAENAFFELLRPDHQAFRQVLDRLDQDPEYRALIIANFTVTHAPYSDVRLEAFCGAYPDQCTMDPETFERMKNIYYGHPNIGYDYRRAEATRDFSKRELGDFASALDLLYRANVHHLDGLVGRLVASIERRGLLDSTAIAFTADHGETLYRETAPYSWGHGYQLSPDAVNVPFILHAPGVGRGESYSGVTRSIDVFPTLAGLARIELASVPGRGVDLSPVLRGEQVAPDLLAFSHSSVLSEPVANSNIKNLDFFRSHFPRRDPELMWVAVKKANRVYKLQRFHEGEFEPAVFDTAVDPHELADVHDPADPAGRQIFERLSRYRAGLVESFGSWMSEGRELPPEQQEELLRALGYIE